MLEQIIARLIEAIAITNSLTISLDVKTLADYHYIAKRKGLNSLLLRKNGFTVIGLEQTSAPKCFRGIVRENKISKVTQIYPPYTPESESRYIEGEVYDLDNYRLEFKISNEDREALLTCINLFWR